jgi:hypothetical protein
VTRVGCAPRLAVATEDIRQFELRPLHVRPSFSFRSVGPGAPAGRAGATGSAATGRPSAQQAADPRRPLSLRKSPRKRRRRPPKPPPGPGTGTSTATAVPAIVPVPGPGPGRCREPGTANQPPPDSAPPEPAWPPSVPPSTRALTQKAFLPGTCVISRPRGAGRARRSYRVGRNRPALRATSCRPPT